MKPPYRGSRFQLSIQLLPLFVCNRIGSLNQKIDQFSTVLQQCKHRKEEIKKTLQKMAALCNKT